MLKTNGTQSCGQNKSDAENRYANEISSDYKLRAGTREIVQSNKSHVKRYTAIASGGVRRSDASLAASCHGLEFIDVNLFGALAARGGRSPGVESTDFSINGHAPFGIHASDIAPANSDFLDRVYQDDCLIGEDDFGSNQNEIGSGIDCYCPTDCCHQLNRASGQKGRPDKEQRENQDAGAHNQTALWSKGFTQSHSSIFSHVYRATDRQVA